MMFNFFCKRKNVEFCHSANLPSQTYDSRASVVMYTFYVHFMLGSLFRFTCFMP